jgi:hypothetical protein
MPTGRSSCGGRSRYWPKPTRVSLLEHRERGWPQPSGEPPLSYRCSTTRHLAARSWRVTGSASASAISTTTVPPSSDGLPEPPPSQELRAHRIERPCRILLLELAGRGHMFAADLLGRCRPRCARYRCSRRRIVSSHRTAGEATPPQFVHRIGNIGMMTRALRPLEVIYPSG